MTHSGGKPHKVGYNGQSHKITVHDADKGARRIIGWTNHHDERANDPMLRGLEERPGWSDAKLEPVQDKTTGDAEFSPPRCRDESAQVNADGECIRCGAAMGETCRDLDPGLGHA